MKPSFKECAECAAKPGSPVLCSSCLINRNTIDNLNRELENTKEKLRKVLEVLGL